MRRALDVSCRTIAMTAAAALLVAVGACDSPTTRSGIPVATTPVTTTTTSTPMVVTQSSTAMTSDIKGKPIYDSAGNKLGVIRDVLADSTGVRSVVLEHGGMLGLGGKSTQIPVNQLQWVGDRIVAPGLTQQSLQ